MSDILTPDEWLAIQAVTLDSCSQNGITAVTALHLPDDGKTWTAERVRAAAGAERYRDETVAEMLTRLAPELKGAAVLGACEAYTDEASRVGAIGAGRYAIVYGDRDYGNLDDVARLLRAI